MPGLFKGIDSRGRPLIAGGEQPRDPVAVGTNGRRRMRGRPNPNGNRAERRAYETLQRKAKPTPPTVDHTPDTTP